MSVPVDFQLNADVSGYTQSMGQAISVSQNYTQTAQGVRGAVIDVSQSFVGATQKITGFTKINSVAADAAAAHEKALANIAATSAVTGRSFSALEESSKKLARTFPIGMQGAVDVVESMQSVGAKSEKQIQSLGKAFVNLGAATNTNAASMGRDFALLGKSMGNGLSSFEALSDSLTTVTKQLGAAPGSTVAFSKALAPIASTVGIGQTAVMGLSAAMSSLGEDGYRAANVFNKVLLDMNRSIRDGGPELKAYADLMGTTSEKLRDLFKSNPTEVLNQFTESLGKSGQSSQRTLEALGFDSVRDTRSLQALSRSGGLRTAIDTSVNAYGNGKTQQAADVAMGGVLDSATKLKETMAQTVENVGAPLLGVMNTQLKIATKVAGALEGATGSGLAQGAGTVGAIGGAVMGGVGTLMQGLMVAAMAKGGFNALRNSKGLQSFRTGMTNAAGGMTMDDAKAGGAGRMERAGMATQGAMMAGGMGSMSDAKTTSGRMFGWGARATGDVSNRFMRGYYGNVLRMGLGEEAWRTPTGQAYVDARKGFREGTVPREDVRAARSAYLRGIGSDPTPIRSLATTTGVIAKDAGRFAVGGLAKTAGMVGAGLGAIGAPMLAAAGGIAAGTWAVGKYNEGQSTVEGIRSASEDIYSATNAFAEATGKAGRGLVSFTQVVQDSTNKMVQSNNTMTKALDVTGTEAANAQKAGYTRAFNAAPDISDPKVIAAQMEATLGASATPEDVARALSDVGNQFGTVTANAVSKEIKPFFTETKKADQDYLSLLKGISESTSLGGWGTALGANEQQGAFAKSALTAAQQKAAEVGMSFGGTKKVDGLTISAQQVETVSQAQKLYEAAQKSTAGRSVSMGELSAINSTLTELFKANEDQQAAGGIRTDWRTTQGNTAYTEKNGQAGQSFDAFLKTMADAGNEAAQVFLTAQKAGMTEDYSWAAASPEAVKNSKDLAKSFEISTNAGEGFSASLYSASDSAQSVGKELRNIPDSMRSSMTGVNRALANLANNTNPKTEQQAGQAILEDVLKRTGGNTTQAQSLLQANMDNAPTNMPELITGLQAATQQLSTGAGAMQSALLGPRGMNAQQMQQGWVAQSQAQSISPQMAASNNMSISVGTQAQAANVSDMKQTLLAFGQMNAGIMAASRSAGIQMGAIARDGALKVKWAWEDHRTQEKRARQDYNIQLQEMDFQHNRQEKRMTKEFNRSERYAREDYQNQKFRATRDFGIQMLRSYRDYEIGVARANRDNNLTITRANRDFQTGQARATEDYNKSKTRSNEDYNKQMMRATRDFGIQQTQATEDYNKARTRSLEDYNKQVRRMVEDSAKQMYDPYKRIAAQMVMDAGQLITNLKDQTKAIDQQVGNLAKARGMGLSEEAIKALNLADASNAQQLSRLVGDMGGNQALVGQMNAQVSAKNTSASALVTDQGNTGYARAAEDFATAQTRMTEDFTISSDRAKEAFTRQMGDAATDFTTSINRMTEDFDLSMARGQQDFDKQMSDNAVTFANQMADNDQTFTQSMMDAVANWTTSMSDMEFEYDKARIRAREGFDQQMTYIDQDYEHSLKVMGRAFKLQMDRADEDVAKAVKRMKIQTANAISDVGAQLGASIAAMRESFNGLMEVTGRTEEELAQQTIDMFAALGGPKGDAQRQLLENAKLVVQHYKDARNYAKDIATYGDMHRQSMADVASMPTSGGAVPQSTYDSQVPSAASMTLPPIQMAGDPVSAMVEMGKAAWDGFTKGFQDAQKDGWGIFQQIFLGLVSGVKGLLGIHSPSTVFAEIGKSIMEGLGQGIQSMATAAWDFVTAPIKDLDIMGKVNDAWSATSKWLGDLGGTITGLIKTGWANLTAPIANLNIMDKLNTAWTEAGQWLGNIGTTISGLVKTGWTNLTSGLATLAGEGEGSIKGQVLSAFSSAKEWVGNLASHVKGWVVDAWSNLTDGLSKLVGDGEGSIKAQVLSAFSSAKTWIGNLADNVKTWVSAGWAGLTAGLSSMAGEGVGTIKNAVVSAFETTKEWISGLAGNITGWLKGAYDSVAARFVNVWGGIGDAFEAVKGAIARAWNQLDVGIHLKVPDNIFFGPMAGKSWDVDDIFPDIPGYATGAIVQQRMVAQIAEGGYPEAVIPLNDRGAAFMADMLGRYASSTEARQTQVSQYSTPVTYNTVSYDQRVQYTGPITVQSQDPDQMNEKLAAKRRRQNLVNPVGARP